jgi:N-acetylmuramoyl-L-alanine amidase
MLGGSSANNATGPTGLAEKTLALTVARLAQQFLELQGYTVLLTRYRDENVGLADRAAVARACAASVFASIHFNGMDGTAQGTETWIHTNASTDSADLAQAVQTAVVGVTGLADRKVKKDGLAVLKPSLHLPDTAACLLEVSFLDVAAEEARLKKADYLALIAEAIANGIDQFLRTQSI